MREPLALAPVLVQDGAHRLRDVRLAVGAGALVVEPGQNALVVKLVRAGQRAYAVALLVVVQTYAARSTPQGAAASDAATHTFRQTGTCPSHRRNGASAELYCRERAIYNVQRQQSYPCASEKCCALTSFSPGIPS